jgi:DNA-binding MarR family transcriptional regulator
VAEPRGPFNSPGFWLHHAALTWRQELDARLRPLGLTHTQFNLLAATSWLQRTGQPPHQQQVAELSGSDRMMTSKVLSGLQDRGLVTRRADPSDARAKRLEVTNTGSRLVSQAVRIVADIDSALFGEDADRTELTERLRAIAQFTTAS